MNILRVSAAGILANEPQSEANKSREAATAYSNLQTLFFSSSRCCLTVLIFWRLELVACKKMAVGLLL